MTELRPHHILCLAHFIGKGYNDGFAKNMAGIKAGLRPNASVRLISGPDDVCGECPHKRGAACAFGDKPGGFDARCLELCGFNYGMELPYGILLNRAYDEIINAGRLGQVCGTCEWYSLCSNIKPGELRQPYKTGEPAKRPYPQ